MTVPDTTMITRHNPAVLVVEDDAEIAALLARVVGELGFAAEITDNGGTAFRAATRAGVQLVICDLRLPEWDGVSAVASLAMTVPELPVVVVSAFLDDDTLERLRECSNVKAIVPKPFTLAKLRGLLKDLLLSGTAGDAPPSA